MPSMGVAGASWGGPAYRNTSTGGGGRTGTPHAARHEPGAGATCHESEFVARSSIWQVWDSLSVNEAGDVLPFRFEPTSGDDGLEKKNKYGA